MNRGAFDFLVKPIDFEDLQRTIDKCAAHVAELREAVSSHEENGILRLLVGQGVADRLVTVFKASGGLEHETFEASVAFVDLHGFSATMASHAPHEVFRHLNAQFDTLVPELLARAGTVCRFIGDSVMTLFEGSDHLSRALDACLAVRDRVRLLDEEIAGGRGQYGAAIGLDTGTVFSGGVGSRTIGRLEHTVLGEAVNTAARLQSLAGKHDILVSGALQPRIANDYICESDGARQLSTRTGVFPVYQVVGRNGTSRHG
jgi:class 3 adenylate cyclase